MQGNAGPIGPELVSNPAGHIETAYHQDAVARVGALAGLMTAPTDLTGIVSLMPTTVSITL